MRQNVFGGRAPPEPAGELERSPRLLAAIGGGVPTSKREGSEGNEKREGREEGRGGEGGKGKDDLHPTLFWALPEIRPSENHQLEC